MKNLMLHRGKCFVLFMVAFTGIFLVSSCTKQPIYGNATNNAVVYSYNADYNGAYNKIIVTIDDQYTSSITDNSSTYNNYCGVITNPYISSSLFVQPLPLGQHNLKLQWIGYGASVLFTNTTTFNINANTCTVISIPNYVF